jgi:hypothetical protein
VSAFKIRMESASRQVHFGSFLPEFFLRGVGGGDKVTKFATCVAGIQIISSEH